MAIINPVFLDTEGDNSVVRVQWGPMANGDVGAELPYTQWADRSVHIEGTFGATGSVRWEGSNDGINYRALSDPQGLALDVTTQKIKAVIEMVSFARPRVTSGDATTALTVTLTARRGQPLRT